MKTCLWHWSVGSIFGGVAATVLFAVVWAARHGGDFGALWADPEPLLIAAVLSALVSGLAAVIISRLSRRPIVQVVKAAPVAAPLTAPPVALQVQTTKPKRRQAPFLSRLMAGRITPELHWDRLSRSLQKLLGVSAKKLRGKSMLKRIHEEDRTVIERRFQNPSKIAFDARFRLLPPKKELPNGKPGELIYVQLTAAPLRDEQNKLVAWRCLFVDVTRQVLAEETRQTQLAALGQAQNKWQRIQRQLDRLKDSYSDLYHNAPVLYFSLDAAGKFVTFNDTLLRTLGYAREELLNRNYADVAVKREQGPPEFDIPSDKEHEWETQWRRRDGSLIDVWLRTIAVFDEKGTFARWRSSALDYTERNRLAKELRTHTEELQHTNSRLRHINSELEDFTHVVSHDLKEPLRTLQAFSHLLAEDFSSQLSTDGFQYVNHLVQASRRLGHLIDDLLNLSHAGRAARAPQQFNLIETVATVRRDLVDLIQRKEATILTEGTLPTVVGDPQRITQLLTNLVANGLKYNKHPEPCVTIGQKEGADDGQVVIYVRDNGIGIDSEHHQQIFGLFRRVNHQEEFEGTGAGLAICKKIVEAHGGRIWVESAAGQGATFYFTLPTT
jgi:PAS domain S-box-containing protein